MQNDKSLKSKNGMWKVLKESDKEKFKSIILQPSENFHNRRNVFLKECINFRKQHTDRKDYIDEISNVQKDAISVKNMLIAVAKLT